MFNWKSGRLASIALIAPVMLGASTVAPKLELQPQSKLWVSGTSTVRSFECTAGDVRVTVNTTGTSPVAEVLQGQKAVTSALVQVPAARMECNNGTMNEHMRKALKADQNPWIEFNVNSYELVPGSNGQKARLNGTLKLGGASKPVAIQSDAKSGGDGVLRVTGEHTVTMSEYGLKRPSLMMGTMKVGDDVKVLFDLYLK